MSKIQQKQCRVCLVYKPMSLSISQQIKQKTIADVISQISGTLVLVNDGFPQFLCNDCKDELSRCIEFKETCVKSDNILRGFDLIEVKLESLVESDEPQFDRDQKIFTAPLETSAQMEVIEIKREDNGDTVDEEEENSEVNKENPTNITKKKNPIKYRIKLTKCCMCLAQFKRHEQLLEHVKETHPNGAEDTSTKYTVRHKHTCKLCLRKFRQKQFLVAHFNQPGYVEPKRSETENNKQGKDEIKVKQRFICTYCGQNYSSRTVLQIHEARKHLSERTFHCDKCSKSFGHRKLLGRHKHEVHNQDIFM